MEVKNLWQTVLRLFAWTYKICQSLQSNRHAATPGPPSKEKISTTRRWSRRLWPLDALRGAAVILMVETHVFNTAAHPGLQNASFAPLWSGIHGLVAPLFFMLTGYALELRPPATPWDLRRRLQSIGLWWALAMLLHLPNRGANGRILDLSPLLRFDVLHALALTGLGLTAVQLTAFRRSTSYVLLTFLTLAGAVMMNRSHWVGTFDPWWQGLVTHTENSRFPLLPWSAFAFSGAWLATLETKAVSWPWTTTAAGWMTLPLLLSVLAFLLGYTSLGRQFTTDGRANPLFTLERAGVVMTLMLAALSFQNRSPGRVGSALAYFGRRSLSLYFIHLFIFFTEFGSHGSWASHVAGRCSVDGIAGTTVLLLGGSMTVCWCAEASQAAFRAQNPLGEMTS